MNIEILNVYNKLVFSYYKLSNIESNRLLQELKLLGLALYVKNLTKDSRSLYQLKAIIEDEYKVTIY